MGLWNWVMDKLVGDAPADTPQENRTTTAVATLDAPEQAGGAEQRASDEAPWWARADATLTEAVGIARPDMPTEVLAIENLIVANFDGHDLSLPPLPRVPEIVLRELSASNSSMRKVAEEIAEDQVCAAAVLRMANSPLYRGMHKITSVEPAVIRLGVGAIRTLMLHQTMRSVTRKEKRGEHNYAEMLSLRAVASASVNRALSRFTGTDAEEAFLIGLLHDIGSVVVLRIVNSQQKFSRFDVDLDAFEYLCFESHQEFGELLADSWGLPEKLTALIASHHTYPADDDPFRQERLQLTLTDMIGSLLGFAPPAAYDLLGSRAARDLNLADDPGFVKFLMQLPDELEATMAVFE